MTAARMVEATPALVFQSVSRTHAGARRKLNEDRLLDRAATGLWAIADGMGGHSAGDVAAAKVIAALERTEHGPSGYGYLDDIAAAVADANAAIFRERGEQSGAISGTTLVALLAHENHYACLWAGDSRAYRFSRGQLSPITRDHSLVQEMIDEGVLEESSRKQHPNAHVITRAVGVAAEIQLDRRFAPIAAGDLFLLCSDGLTSCLDDDELARMLTGADLEAMADRLLSTALERLARDNVSLILVRAAQAG